jgi:MFS family permease
VGLGALHRVRLGSGAAHTRAWQRGGGALEAAKPPTPLGLAPAQPLLATALHPLPTPTPPPTPPHDTSPPHPPHPLPPPPKVMLMSFLGPAIQCQWSLAPDQLRVLTSVVFAGMVVGGPLWGSVSDGFGRKTAFAMSVICTTTFGILSAAANSYEAREGLLPPAPCLGRTHRLFTAPT